MILASGFVEANGEKDVARVSAELAAVDVEITETRKERLIFLIEREEVREVKRVLESLKDFDGVRAVYLAYYSMEGSDEEMAALLSPEVGQNFAPATE